MMMRFLTVIVGAVGAACVWLTTGSMQLPSVPGAINGAVTQLNIASTICTSGWAHYVRPSVTETQAIKLRLLPAGHKPSEYELDHLVPLELGGAPRDMRNLWMQPIAEARIKDKLENDLHDLVCAGKLPLAEAQRCIADNWIACRAKTP